MASKAPCGVVPPSPEQKALNLIRYGLQRNGIDSRREFVIMQALNTGSVSYGTVISAELMHEVMRALATAIRDGIGIA